MPLAMTWMRRVRNSLKVPSGNSPGFITGSYVNCGCPSQALRQIRAYYIHKVWLSRSGGMMTSSLLRLIAPSRISSHISSVSAKRKAGLSRSGLARARSMRMAPTMSTLGSTSSSAPTSRIAMSSTNPLAKWKGAAPMKV